MNMNLNMFKNDFKRNPAGNIALILFMTLSVTLVVAATIVVVQLTTSMTGMYKIAEPPHFLQMHKGEIDQEAIDEFTVSYEGVTSWQTSPMINVYGDDLRILGEQPFSLADSRLDISLVKQNTEKDLLLDSNRKVINVNKGEIGVPVIFLSSYDINIGDTIEYSSNGITKKFKVTTFVHDAQMNSTLVYSTRMLISDEDFVELFGNVGESEYLIETYFTDSGMASDFQSAYENAGLPQNGPAVTYQMIFLISAFTDILMAMIIILVSLLLVLVALMSIKYTLMASLEEEIGEIGTMKAIGMTHRDIRDIYLKKYKLMIALGIVIGYVIALALASFFTSHVSNTFGKQPLSIWTIGIPILACLSLYVISNHYCKKILKKIKKVTVVDALVFGKGFDQKKRVHDGLYKSKQIPINLLLSARETFYHFKGFFLIFISMMIVTSIMIVPMNLLSTLKSKDFIPYMGSSIGDVLVEIDIGENLENRYAALHDLIKTETDIKDYSEIKVVRVETANADKQWMNLRVGSGDAAGKKLKYIDGKEPIKENEIAVSKLNANEMGKQAGDKAILRFNGIEKTFFISGVYQDVTSGGMTAKSKYSFEGVKAEKYQLIVNVNDKVDIEEKAAEWSSEMGTGYDIQPMEELIDQTLGVVSKQVQVATIAVMTIGILMSAFIIVLFMKLRLIKDASQIAIIKAIGFTNKDVKKQYLYKMSMISFAGIMSGTIVSNILGEKIISLAFNIMGLGISELTFIVNLWIVFLFVPLVLLIVAASVTWFSTRNIKDYNIISLINE
ncbi:hypothetical protein Plano_0574 [Planococcus sp. PAMC 21323]|uniref:ABC transporter permease n=1 Tax=Planococcus sp. PAMC 21323 TaxID=1526927 RepID=UPI000586240A|nr:ABC transporter permease [Planococcus sp. PAMC 21323]AIY04539.1 hypothetical protein Plano_0574 [Planococcus sp. PAMC 21323]